MQGDEYGQSEVDAPTADQQWADETPRRKREPVRLTVVTDSEAQTFRACPNLHHFKYRERLRPLVAPKVLALGSIFHAGMRAGLAAGWAPGFQQSRIETRVAHQIETATAGIDDLVSKWAGKIVQHTKDVDYERLAEEVDETAKLVKWMLAHYFDRARADLESLLLVDAEHPFSVAVRDKRGRETPHLVHSGVRDALLYDPTYNQLVLMEHKTSGGDPRTIDRRVEMDTQTAGYLNAVVEELMGGWNRERPALLLPNGLPVPASAGVGRTVYNVLAKSMPREPKINKDGKVSVAQCVTTVDIYTEALRVQRTDRKIEVTTDQAEFLHNLAGQGDRFFYRAEWMRTPAEVERWRSDMMVDARRIRSADRNPEERTRNTGHCNMPWSLPCTYRQICLDPDAPELRKQFRVAEEVHAEVRAAETEVP